MNNATHTLETALIALKQSENEVKAANESYIKAVDARNFHKDFRNMLTGYPRYEFTPEGWVKELVRLEKQIGTSLRHFSKIVRSSIKTRELVSKLEEAECIKNATR